MIIDKVILDELTAKAKENPRLRCNLDMRNSADDQSQRMLNALEPGTVMPIHRHKATSETVIIIRGRIRWLFYDEQGRITESTELWSDGDVRMLNVEKGRWHSLECLESGSVLFEAKDGPYHPLEEDEIMNLK
jgi:cupin fold WbuC family metalloprotein